MRVAAAQCFQDRGRLCHKFLGEREVPPNLRDPSAWRVVVRSLMETGPGEDEGFSKERISAAMKDTHTTDKRPELPWRRRQRYIF